MKMLLLALLFSTASQVALAGNGRELCLKKSVSAVLKYTEGEGYDRDGIEGVNCLLSEDKTAVFCDVAAYKGGGDAADMFTVLLDKRCQNVLQVELKFEE